MDQLLLILSNLRELNCEKGVGNRHRCKCRCLSLIMIVLLYLVSGEVVVYFCPIPVKAPLGFKGYRDDDEVVAARLLQFDFTEFLHIDIHGGPRDACSAPHVRCCADLTAQDVQGEPVIVGPRKSRRLQKSGIIS